MKKKHLAMFLAVSMALSLCACGGGGDSGTVSAPDGAPAISGLIEVDEPTEAGSPTDTLPTNDKPIQSEPQGSDPVMAEPLKPEGLILMTTTDASMRDPIISSIDVETGESRVVAEFDFRPQTLQGSISYYPAAGFFCGHRHWFADDYSKIAVSMTDTQSGQTCAGWMDADGNFFNVSEALDQLIRSDFSDPVQYYAVGFMNDELFVYRQISGTGTTAKNSYHYVPLDNLNSSAVQDGLPFPGCEGGFPDATVSDQIDDSRFIINTSDGVSKILDMTTGSKTDYIPGTSRFSWHGVVSPNGDQVAFMSQPKNGTEKDIYIMPLTGGDPMKAPTDGFSLSNQQTCESGHGHSDQCTMLVEWR